jgi:hypothetical protein
MLTCGADAAHTTVTARATKVITRLKKREMNEGKC